MIQFLHKILAFILALVVLFSTFSFTVEKHVCMGEVTDISYFTEVDTCGMIEDNCMLNDEKHTSFEKENCCDNIVDLIPGNQNEQQALQNLKINQVQFVLIFNYAYVGLFKEKEQPIAFNFYPPPIVDKNIQALYQTFLI